MKNNSEKIKSSIENKPYIGKAKGPINIALIKYWGKDDEKLITPLNNSISLTLDTNTFYTETKVTINLLSPKNENQQDIISLKINGEPNQVTSRIKNVISKFKSLKNPTSLKISSYQLKIDIESKNTFPIASGCASSASSMAALVVAFSSALKLSKEEELSANDLSKIARIGSGSACRSIMGGINEWIKEGGEDSHAEQLHDEKYWDLGIKLIIVSQGQKEVSSSLGMKITKETSQLFKYRINEIVNENLKKIKEAIDNKNFNDMAEIIMKDSNNFHACCRDSFPTINYLNEQSEFIIKSVVVLNDIMNKNICAYTFDAGSNGFIIFDNKNKNIIDHYFNYILGFIEDDIFVENFLKEINIDDSDELNKNKIKENIISIVNKRPPKEKIIKYVNFSLGQGTIVLDN